MRCTQRGNPTHVLTGLTLVSEYILAGLWSVERRVAAQAGRALLTMLADPRISGDREEGPGQPAARTVAYEHHTRVKLRVTRLKQ